MKDLKITPHLCIPQASASANTTHMVGSLVRIKVNTQSVLCRLWSPLTCSRHVFPTVNPRNFEEGSVQMKQNTLITSSLQSWWASRQSTHLRPGSWHGKHCGRVSLEQVMGIHIEAASWPTAKSGMLQQWSRVTPTSACYAANFFLSIKCFDLKGSWRQLWASQVHKGEDPGQANTFAFIEVVQMTGITSTALQRV